MKTTTNKNDIRAILTNCCTRQHRIDDYTKNTAALVIDGDKCFRFTKPSIETSFCHPDEPEQEARAWLRYSRTYEHFSTENLAGIDRRFAKMYYDPRKFIFNAKYNAIQIAKSIAL